MLNELYTFAEPVQVVPFSNLKWGKFTLLHTLHLNIHLLPTQSDRHDPNLTINPSSILSGRHILHLPYDMHIVQRLKS